MYGRRPTLQTFGRLDVGITDDEVRQGIHLALNNRDVSPREVGVNNRGSDRTTVAQITGDQTLNPANAAVDEDRVQIQPMFFEDPDLFSQPVDHRRTRRIGDVSDVTSRMDGVRKGGQNERGQQRNRKQSKHHRQNLLVSRRPRGSPLCLTYPPPRDKTHMRLFDESTVYKVCRSG